jgi:hypothetical protein
MEQHFNPSNSATITKIDMQDIIGNLQYDWMLVLFAMSILIFIYVMFKNFVRFKPDSKYVWIEKELDIMALTPAIFIVVICLTFFLNIKGV